MPSLLRWRDTSRDDPVSLFQAFTCAEPSSSSYNPSHGQKYHPRPWELEVQSGIRAYQPRVRPGERFQIGLDNQGIGAVSYIGMCPNERHTITIMAIAVSVRWRHRGGQVADEAMEATKNGILSLVPPDWDDIVVFGRVHRNNTPSQEMCRRHGLICAQSSDVADHDDWLWPIEIES